MKIFPYTRHQLGQLSRILFSVTVLEKMRFLVSWTLIQVTSKNETRFFSSKGEGGGGEGTQGSKTSFYQSNISVATRHHKQQCACIPIFCLKPHPKKGWGNYPFWSAIIKGKFHIYVGKSWFQQTDSTTQRWNHDIGSTFADLGWQRLHVGSILIRSVVNTTDPWFSRYHSKFSVPRFWSSSSLASTSLWLCPAL